MAKVVTEYDTNTKEMKHSHDGVEMDNVSHVGYEKSGTSKDGANQYEMRMMQVEKDAEHDTTKVHHTYAADINKKIHDYLIARNTPLSQRQDSKKV